MPVLEPFAGLRYDTSRVSLDDVIAPPYDVVDDVGRSALAARSPYNAIAVELPGPSAGQDRYSVAAATFQAWEASGVLRREPEPALYAYRMSYNSPSGALRSTTGVIGALRLEPPGEGDVLPHERTMPKPKSDRLDLLAATRMNTSPVWGLSLASGLSQLIAPQGPPTATAVDDGVTHELWVLSPEDAELITKALNSAPVVLADGHHRWETALGYAAQRNQTDGPGPWDAAMALVVELVDSQLEVGAIHRLLSGEPSGEALRALLSRYYELEAVEGEITAASLSGRLLSVSAPALVSREGAWWLRALPETNAAAEEDLDAARLAVALAGNDGIELTYANSPQEIDDALASGRAQSAVVVRPATVAQIAEVARDRRRMPPKTTFFRPKPRTGMVFRPLDKGPSGRVASKS